MRRNLILVLTLLSSLTSSATLDNDQPLTGYSTEGTRVERDWEGKFRLHEEAYRAAAPCWICI